MNKEYFIKMYKNTKKEEIIEELFYKCTANYRLNNIINELEKALVEELDRLEKLAIEYSKKRIDNKTLILLRGKVADIYCELKELKEEGK